MKKIVIGALGLSLGALPLPAQTPASPAPAAAPAAEHVRTLEPLPEDTLQAIRSRGKIRVGVSLFVPWAAFDKTGQLAGYQIDLARKLAEDLGVELELHPSSPTGLIPDLHEGQIDLIASGMNVTPQRALVVNFSAPTGHSELQLLASRRLAANLRTLNDFNREGVTIAVRTGTPVEDVAKRLFPRAKLVPVDAPYPSGYQEVLDGKVHAVLGYSPLPEAEAARVSNAVFLPLREPVARFAEAFAVRPGDESLLRYLDSWLLAHTEDGWLTERKNHWFKTFDWVKEF